MAICWLALAISDYYWNRYERLCTKSSYVWTITIPEWIDEFIEAIDGWDIELWWARQYDRDMYDRCMQSLATDATND